MTPDTIGLDISKGALDFHRLSDGAHRQFANSPSGLSAAGEWIGGAPLARVVYEPTGPYHAAFERRFAGRLPLAKVNPLQARRFAQAHGTRAKTDAVDARMLARMGAAFALEPDRPLDQNARDLKEMSTARAAMMRDRTALLNRLRTQTIALLQRQARARIAQLERQIKALDDAIDARMQACPERRSALRILRSVPGIAAITARAILSHCPEIGTLAPKQAAALAGLAPMTRQSGKWHGRARIEGGRKPLRDALYMPAIVAKRHNPDLAEKYADLRAKGKPHKLAITVIMRKLLILANTLVKEDREWQPNQA